MNVRIPPEPPEPSSPQRKEMQQSPQASQASSEGPQLPSGIQLFSRFVWAITFAWTHTSFVDWISKNQLQQALVKELGGSSTIESHLNALTLPELRSLKNLLNEEKDAVVQIVQGVANKTPNRLYEVLKHLATPDGKKLIQDMTKVSEDQTEVGWNILEETGVSNGTSDRGFQYELRSLFSLPKSTEKVENFQGNVEIIVTNPKTKETRRLLIPIIASGVGAIHEELRKLENGLKFSKKENDYSHIAQRSVELLNSKLVPRIDTPDQFVEAFRQGNIYFDKRELSLFPLEPIILGSGNIDPSEIERAQAVLRGETNLPQITYYTDKKGTSAASPCTLKSRTVVIENQKYLELNIGVPDKSFTYTTRIPYKEKEPKGALIVRIGTDGSLARALLMASSALTRKLV